LVKGQYATVSGGNNNSTSGEAATVGGGQLNEAGAQEATVGGGRNNKASGVIATVSGGKGNEASGERATVPGGAGNVADGDYSFAVGREARTDGNDGAVVFADSSADEVRAQGPDEIRSQMPIYAPNLNNTSARAAKTAIEPVDTETVLTGVESLEVSTWEFKETDDVKHIGPMAEEFHETFDVGADDGTIATVDADGVAIAAVQELADRTDELAEENEQLREDLTEKQERIARLEAENEELRERVESIEERVNAIDHSDEISE
jgi:FtsZ-binding cell division protein ZapB